MCLLVCAFSCAFFSGAFSGASFDPIVFFLLCFSGAISYECVC